MRKKVDEELENVVAFEERRLIHIIHKRVQLMWLVILACVEVVYFFLGCIQLILEAGILIVSRGKVAAVENGDDARDQVANFADEDGYVERESFPIVKFLLDYSKPLVCLLGTRSATDQGLYLLLCVSIQPGNVIAIAYSGRSTHHHTIGRPECSPSPARS